MSGSFSVLLVDDEPEIQSLMELAILSSGMSIKITKAESGEAALKHLETSPEQNLIISDYMMPGMGGLEFRKIVLNKWPGIPFVFCSGNLPQEAKDDKLFAIIEKPNIINPTIEILKKLLSKENTQSGQMVVPIGPEYAPILTDALAYMGTLPADVYIRLGEDKYIKYFSANDYFGAEDHTRLRNKKIATVYLKTADCVTVAKYFEQQWQTLAQVKNNKKQDDIVFFKDEVSFLSSSLKIYQCSPEAIEATKKWSQNALTTISTSQNKTLSNLIKKALENPTSYESTHIALLSTLAVEIATCMDWKTEGSLLKLMLAALLHDLKLDEGFMEHKGAKGELNQEKDKKNFAQHPQLMAEFCQTIKELPPDVDRLILEHHESPLGDGFPKKLAALNTGPLSCLFIMAHELANALWENSLLAPPLPPEDVFKRLGERYQKGPYKKIWGAFIQRNPPT